MKIVFCSPVTVILVLLIMGLQPWSDVAAQDVKATEPTRYGIAVAGGATYGRDDISYGLATGFALFDYDRVWPHRAPEPLRFKVEVSAGSTTHPFTKFMTSANIFALYYLRLLETNVLTPYVEGGIGAIYTDFQVRGQGSRINFNPQIGIGTDIRVNPKRELFVAARLHHLSNGGLDHDNRGVNFVLLMLGMYF